MAKKCSAAIPMYLNIENEQIEITALIEYTITPGCPAQGPSYASGGEPAEPAEIEIREVELEISDPRFEGDRFREPCPKWLFDYLANSSDVYENLGEHGDWGKAYQDPDDARDQQRDDADMFNNSYSD